MSKKKKAKQKELDSAKLNKQTAIINIITANCEPDNADLQLNKALVE